MSEFISTITPFLHHHRYIFAFLGAFFEGNSIMLLCGFLYKLGIFKFLNIIAVLSLGYFINGYILYAIGRFWGRRVLEKWGSRFFLTKERLRKLERYCKKHMGRALIITRITYGFSMPTFIIAGMFKTKAKKFFWCSLIATFIWVLALFFIGYVFGTSYALLSKLVKLVAAWLVVALFIVIVLIAMFFVYWLRRSAEMKFLEKSLNQERWKWLKWLGKKIGEFLNKDIT